MKTNKELMELTVEELDKISDKHWYYVRKIDALIKYKKNFEDKKC